MSDGSSTPRNPYTRPGFIVAAVVVAAVVAAAIVVLTSGFLSGPAPTPTVSETPSEDVDEPSAADRSVCGLDGFERSSSLDAAPENDWELVGTVAAPTSPASGPGVIDDDGFRSCFAHTAEGALFAAVNFGALGTDATLASRMLELVADGPGRDAVADAIASSGGAGGLSGLRAQVAGFRIGAYDGDAATVDLAMNYNDGRLISVPLKLIWETGDWKVVFTDAGELPLQPAALSNLGGYIPWAGA